MNTESGSGLWLCSSGLRLYLSCFSGSIFSVQQQTAMSSDHLDNDFEDDIATASVSNAFAGHYGDDNATVVGEADSASVAGESKIKKKES